MRRVFIYKENNMLLGQSGVLNRTKCARECLCVRSMASSALALSTAQHFHGAATIAIELGLHGELGLTWSVLNSGFWAQAQACSILSLLAQSQFLCDRAH